MAPEITAAVDALRGYLDRVGFQQVYKFIVGFNQYSVAPSLISQHTAGDVARFFDTVLKDCSELALLQCLMYGRTALMRALSDVEKPVADALLRANLLRQREDGETLVAADLQLIAAFGLDLLVDRRIHFGGDVHEVYIGPDSYWMLYYVNALGIRREHRAVDLCTGTGIAALYLSLFSDRVLATDIGSAPLALVQINRCLNRRQAQIEVRREDLRDTLDGREQFDVLTCNPPFVALPPGLQGPLYAHGTDIDGLGYMRTIIERLPSVMSSGGCAYLVADLVGDKRGPHFVEELEDFAASGSLAIDVYIDHVIPAAAQVGPLAAFLERLNAGRERAEIATELEVFQHNTVQAERYYLSTLRLRTAASNPGVRVMRRFALPRETSEETWPALLLRT